MEFPNLRHPAHLLATWFGVGLLRPAPGTWGTLAGLLTWYFLPQAHPWIWLILPLFILLSWFVCELANKTSDSGDHSSIVIDEVAGILVTLAFVPHTLLAYGLAFFLFRLFDILKPSFIYSVQFLKGSWGVMLDDILAGVLSLLVLWGITA